MITKKTKPAKGKKKIIKKEVKNKKEVAVRKKTVKKKNSKKQKGAGEVKVEVKIDKPKMAIVSLTCCEGCEFALLDLGQRFLDIDDKVEIIDFRMIEDQDDLGMNLDLVFVEGSPLTEDNLKLLREARRRSRLLIALGNCAAMGGIPEIKNYQEGASTIKHVYKYIHGIHNPEIKELDNFVKVDFTLPGCPINAEEFLKYLPLLLEACLPGRQGKVPVIHDQPVCLECRRKGNRCLLLDKKPCFGPMILGGCDAVCPTAKMMCQGCRGLRPSGNVKAMKSTLKNMMTDEEFENTAEIYGLRDDIEEREAQMV